MYPDDDLWWLFERRPTRDETLRVMREHYARWLTTGDPNEWAVAHCYASLYMPRR